MQNIQTLPDNNRACEKLRVQLIDDYTAELAIVQQMLENGERELEARIWGFELPGNPVFYSDTYSSVTPGYLNTYKVIRNLKIAIAMLEDPTVPEETINELNY
jgi:hypothetical protein